MRNAGRTKAYCRASLKPTPCGERDLIEEFADEFAGVAQRAVSGVAEEVALPTTL